MYAHVSVLWTRLEWSSPLFTESVGIQLPRSYSQPPYQQPASYTPYQDQPIEEKSELEKSLEAFLEFGWQIQNMKDSQAYQSFQIQDPYSIFQVPQQQEESTDLERVWIHDSVPK